VVNGTDKALRAPGGPFFNAETTRQDAPPAQATQIIAPKKVTREARLKAGGLPPVALAEALQRILKTPAQRVESDKAIHERSVKLDLETMAVMRRFIDKRGLPKWIREAVQFISDNNVPMERVATEAAELREKRRGAASERTTVTLNDKLLMAVNVIGKKTDLTDKEVLEGCAGLYLKAHQYATGQDMEGKSVSGAKAP
jgi:hypothetical protein